MGRESRTSAKNRRFGQFLAIAQQAATCYGALTGSVKGAHATSRCRVAGARVGGGAGRPEFLCAAGECSVAAASAPRSNFTLRSSEPVLSCCAAQERAASAAVFSSDGVAEAVPAPLKVTNAHAVFLFGPPVSFSWRYIRQVLASQALVCNM
jgi:hypothetical protein